MAVKKFLGHEALLKADISGHPCFTTASSLRNAEYRTSPDQVLTLPQAILFKANNPDSLMWDLDLETRSAVYDDIPSPDDWLAPEGEPLIVVMHGVGLLPRTRLQQESDLLFSLAEERKLLMEQIRETHSHDREAMEYAISNLPAKFSRPNNVVMLRPKEYLTSRFLERDGIAERGFPIFTIQDVLDGKTIPYLMRPHAIMYPQLDDCRSIDPISFDDVAMMPYSSGIRVDTDRLTLAQMESLRNTPADPKTAMPTYDLMLKARAAGKPFMKMRRSRFEFTLDELKRCPRAIACMSGALHLGVASYFEQAQSDGVIECRGTLRSEYSGPRVELLTLGMGSTGIYGRDKSLLDSSMFGSVKYHRVA